MKPKEKYLDTVMKEKGISNNALSDKINVSRVAIRAWRRGVNYPNMYSLAILCDATGTTPNDWFEMDGKNE